MKALREALLKLYKQSPLLASQLTKNQSVALDKFIYGTQYNIVSCQKQGRGNIYGIVNRDLFMKRLVELSPQVLYGISDDIPQRAKNIAYAKDSKAGEHKHEYCYVLIKAVGENVFWQKDVRKILVSTAQDCGTWLGVKEDDTWETEHPLWLVENLALLENTNWFPEPKGTILYYAGNLKDAVLNWLANQNRSRYNQIKVFADYDGVGLSNFARIYKKLGDNCLFYLMPDWKEKLKIYGNDKIWRNTSHMLKNIQLPDYLNELVNEMRQLGLALEQEDAWNGTKPINKNI